MKPDKRICAIADQLEQQLTDPLITDGIIWEKMGLSRSAYYRVRPKAIEELNRRLMIRQTVIQEASAKVAVQAALNGLKTRQERLMILQQQVDEIMIELSGNRDVQYVVLVNEVGKRVMQKVTTEMNANTRGYLRRTIRELQAEISKIEGDYAAEKRKHEFPEPLKIITAPVDPDEIDYSKLSTDVLETLLQIATKTSNGKTGL